MAWIMGSLNPSELAVLRGRGWRVETLDKFDGVEPSAFGDDTYGCYIDNDMFKIMDGPDWDKGDKGESEREQWQEEVLNELTTLDFPEWLAKNT